MARARRGRPSKGDRRRMRITLRVANSLIVDRLRAVHTRRRVEIITGALVVGMHHLNELEQARFTWHTVDVSAPELAGVEAVERYWEADPDQQGDLYREIINIPEAYARILDTICKDNQSARVTVSDVRAAILWIGLNHRDELANAIAEVDEVNRTHQPGQTVIAFFEGSLSETTATVEDLHYARELLRQGSSVEQAAAAVNMPANLLAAIAALDTTDKSGGDLALTG